MWKNKKEKNTYLACVQFAEMYLGIVHHFSTVVEVILL